MIDHNWRKGERVISTVMGDKHNGKPSKIIGFGYSYGYGEAKTFFKLETEDTREVFYAPVIALQSLEESPEEGYIPEHNPNLKRYRELFDENGKLIDKRTTFF